MILHLFWVNTHFYRSAEKLNESFVKATKLQFSQRVKPRVYHWIIILVVGLCPFRCLSEGLHSQELKSSKSWRGLYVLVWAAALWEGLLLRCDLQTCFHCKHGRSFTRCAVLLFCPQLIQGVGWLQISLDRPWHLNCVSCFSEYDYLIVNLGCCVMI